MNRDTTPALWRAKHRLVLAWMRRATPHWHQYRGYRVTERVAQAIADGLEIVP